MKSAVESLNPTRVKLTVEVPFEELEPSVAEAYKTIAGQVTVPGFRKGKVPPRIIDQRFGRGTVLQEAVNEAVPKFYGQAAEENSLRVLGPPQLEVTDVPDPADGGDLRFTAEVDVRPRLEIPDFSTLAVTVADAPVPDEDADVRLEQLRERFGTLVGVDRAAADEDFVSIDIRGQIDGEEVDSAKGLSYQVGAGTMLDGLDEALTGLGVGQSASFTAPLAGGEHEGEDAEITVTLQSVKERQLPAVDDDFAQLASEFDTLAELRDDLRGQAERAARTTQGIQARDRLLEALLAAVEVPVPAALVEAEVHQHLESEGRLDDEEHRAEVTEEATKALKTQLLLDAVVEKEEVSVNHGEFIEYLVAAAPRYGMDPNSFAEAVDQAGQVQAMVSDVARNKALALLLRQARITDASGAVLDIDELVPPSPASLLDEEDADDDVEDLAEVEADVLAAVDEGPAGDDPAAVRL